VRLLFLRSGVVDAGSRRDRIDWALESTQAASPAAKVVSAVRMAPPQGFGRARGDAVVRVARFVP
jgi:hypothetical protein